MCRKEILEDYKKSIQERLKRLSEILSVETDTMTKEILVLNHKEAFED